MHHREIFIKSSGYSVKAVLNYTATATKIWENLPIWGNVNFWGDEIYFEIPIKGEKDVKEETVEKGDLGYWDRGSAFCIFFGKTPVSTTEEIKPASPVIVIGKVTGDTERFKKMTEGETITVEKLK